MAAAAAGLATRNLIRVLISEQYPRAGAAAGRGARCTRHPPAGSGEHGGGGDANEIRGMEGLLGAELNMQRNRRP